MRVALVHDWLTGMRGGEKVLEVFCELYPDADLYTLLHLPGSVSRTIESMKIHTSFLQRLPFVSSRYRHYLPLFPLAIESFDLHDYDLVISLSHCVALGVVTRPDTCHICYCFTPMRYIWDMSREYFGVGRTGRLNRVLIPLFLNRLRMWDVTASHRVDHFIAISRYVASRIRKCYRRGSSVIYPPVETHRFQPIGEHDDYYLIVSALSPYKRLDVAIEACNRTGDRLIIIGSGPCERQLRKMAGPSVTFLGWQSDSVVAEYMGRCRAFLFCGEEDFGITVLEAHAAGRPVIAYKAGGALETVIDGESGVFFDRQTPESLQTAIEKSSARNYQTEKIRDHARQFDRKLFSERLAASIDRILQAPTAEEGHL